MRYAVTGGTGFVGGHLARLLRRSGHEVTALVRRPEAAADLASLGTRLVPGDLDDDAALARLLDGADGLFHVAALYRVGLDGRAEAQRVNVDGTRRVLAAARTAGTPRVVHTSSLAVNSDTRGSVRDESFAFEGRHVSVYDETKAAAHALALEAARAGQDVVVVMPGLVYGPGDTSQTGELLREVLDRRPVVVPSSGRLCWAHVDDVARGHLHAMERGRPGEAYMLAGPAHGLAEGLRLAARSGGGRPPTVVPGALVRALAEVTDALARGVPVPGRYRGETLRAAAATYLGSAAKAERELGWSARPLAAGLPDAVAAVRSARLHRR